MKTPLFPCKYHQKGGFSMAMLVLGRVSFANSKYDYLGARKPVKKQFVDLWLVIAVQLRCLPYSNMIIYGSGTGSLHLFIVAWRILGYDWVTFHFHDSGSWNRSEIRAEAHWKHAYTHTHTHLFNYTHIYTIPSSHKYIMWKSNM